MLDFLGHPLDRHSEKALVVDAVLREPASRTNSR
jgi:hypothetical protein